MKPIDLGKLTRAWKDWEYFQITVNGKQYHCSIYSLFPYLPNMQAILVRPPDPLHINGMTVFYNRTDYLILRKGKLYYVNSYDDGQLRYYTSATSEQEFEPPEWFKRILSVTKL